MLLIKASEKRSTIKIDDFQFNYTIRPNIKLDKKAQTQIVIEISLDELLLTKFDIVIKKNILNFIRLITRADKSGIYKYRIGSLHMYKKLSHTS